MPVAYCAGVWDFCHIGHHCLLERAKEKYGTLVVGVVPDEEAAAYKCRPRYDEKTRIKAILRLDLTTDVILSQRESTANLMSHLDVCKRYGVTHIVHGDDPGWTLESYHAFMGGKQLDDIGVKVEFIKHTAGISSTMLRAADETTK